MNLYPNRHGTKINIGFTINNKTPWLMHARCSILSNISNAHGDNFRCI